ncbi:Transmembrane 9 superfamily member 7 [Hypsizygus marmoreus]|uniref:Transmembrane 9 superfamily member n=1 Tax=Hypsizygus marmoreus TaxID=39966 RepID=A0A369JYE8_HYPMA|nr:Transmembrane 9 superfamily member 7 [Hypsizygus marmoreus]
MRLKPSVAAALLVPACAQAFYLPGAAPHDYVLGEPIALFVNALTPKLMSKDDSKLKSMINYDYYNPKFRFCEPEGGPVKQPESLGAILFGDRIFNSPYDIKMLNSNRTCQTLCTVPDVTGDEAKFINDRIREDYELNWLVDGLPAAEMKIDKRSQEVFFDQGFNLGSNEGEPTPQPALNNHYDVVFRYHKPTANTYRIVGVLVWPSSIGDSQTETATCDTSSAPLILSEAHNQTIRYTYRVTWNESDTSWATRWDNYLHLFDPRIHWFSLINSVVIVVFLCVMVSMILVRSVSRDISRYNAIDLSEDVQEDWGWKLVHGEVFRTPQNPMVLSIMVGNGAQLCAMVGVTLVFALLGFLSPSNRGSLATVMMVCWSFFGSIGGYFSSRLYATLGGTNRRKNSFLTATILPSIVFAIFFILNLCLLTAGSSGAVPFGTMLLIVLLWFGISAPLSAIGSYFGSKKGAVQHPVRVNQIPRQIPPGPKYLRPWSAALLSGILPFGAAFVELYFVLTSLFASRAYYAFGFLALTAGVVGLTTATVTILFTYFILCAEEYRWHWRAFLTGGGSAFWVFAYGLFYWATRLSLDSLSGVVIYLGYLILITLVDFLVTGTIGFLASYWAVRRLYTAIRID